MKITVKHFRVMNTPRRERTLPLKLLMLKYLQKVSNVLKDKKLLPLTCPKREQVLSLQVHPYEL